MTLEQARDYVMDFDENALFSDEEEFQYIECLKLLINELHEPKYMMWLGGRYHAGREFELAYKYYEMAAQYDYPDAYEALGYIWYYGYTGTVDYKKAFEYFTRASELGSVVAEYKLADMYKEGYGVTQDYLRHVAMIEDLYERIKHTEWLHDPLPEIFLRYARIRKQQGCNREAAKVLDYAQGFLAQRIQRNAFWGYLETMQAIVEEYYSLVEFDPEKIGMYDLFYLMKDEAKARLYHDGKIYYVESHREGRECTIHYYSHDADIDQWYPGLRQFFGGAEIDGAHFTTKYYELLDWEVQ